MDQAKVLKNVRLRTLGRIRFSGAPSSIRLSSGSCRRGTTWLAEPRAATPMTRAMTADQLKPFLIAVFRHRRSNYTLAAYVTVYCCVLSQRRVELRLLSFIQMYLTFGACRHRSQRLVDFAQGLGDLPEFLGWSTRTQGIMICGPRLDLSCLSAVSQSSSLLAEWPPPYGLA